MSDPYRIADFGPSDLLTSANENKRRVKTALPDQLFDGNKALTVQPFTELNIKNGVQYYVRASWPLADSIASGASKNIYFQLGAKDVLTKVRILDYIGEELTLEIFSSPDVTGGTPLSVSNWNLRNPVVTTVTATKDVTVNDPGTPAGDAEYFFGGGSQGQRVASSIPEGFERVVPANSDFLIRITNTGGGTARAQYFLTWYEGELSVDVPFDY